MQQFYCPNLSENNVCLLSADESKHTQILRLNKGDSIRLFNGKGAFAEAIIESVSKKGTEVRTCTVTHLPTNPYLLHLIIAPTKNMARMEWLIEKATEIGIRKISFAHTTRTERKKIMLNRLEKISIEACKQSGKFFLPEISVLTTFEKIKDIPEEQKYIATCLPEEKMLLQTIAKPNKTTAVLIGPEGDFTPAETQFAKEYSFVPVSMGNERLRTETAGLYACAFIHNIQQS